MSPPRGRYAPSPTGRLHLGNAQTAMLAWLDARARGGRFVLRIEDLDRDRVRPGYEAAMLADLAWLGLDWDEGPDVGGPLGPYRQSERLEHYRAALERIEVFACSCSRRALRAEGGEAQGDVDGGPRYPGTCRAGPRDPLAPLALRFRVPMGVFGFTDRIQGPFSQDVLACVSDFVVKRADGVFTYQLAVVVDDEAMAITDVVRGADLLDSTPRQLALQAALGARALTYAHAPVLRGHDGQKLSKRHGAPDLSALRERGVDPRLVVAALGRRVGLVLPGVERVALSELVAGFELTRVPAQVPPLQPGELTGGWDP